MRGGACLASRRRGQVLLPPAARCNAITMGAVACPAVVGLGHGDGLRGRVLGEIVSSERKYLNSLRVLEVVYKDVIQRRARHFGIRKESDIAAIFGNLTSLIDLHEEICAQMEANPESSPRVIREHSSWLALYVQYSNGYNDAAAQLTILTKRLPRLRDYLKQQEQDLDASNRVLPHHANSTHPALRLAVARITTSYGREPRKPGRYSISA